MPILKIVFKKKTFVKGYLIMQKLFAFYMQSIDYQNM